jgi:DNA-binding NarL/FixJ family response regulator
MNVLIVDDNAQFRTLARHLLENGGFVVVGEASDAAEAVQANHLLRPDVILLDIQLPDQDGFTVAELVAKESDPPRVVFISTHDRAVYRHRLARLPASTFLDKGALTAPVFRAAIGA